MVSLTITIQYVNMAARQISHTLILKHLVIQRTNLSSLFHHLRILQLLEQIFSAYCSIYCLGQGANWRVPSNSEPFAKLASRLCPHSLPGSIEHLSILSRHLETSDHPTRQGLDCPLNALPAYMDYIASKCALNCLDYNRVTSASHLI